jgi:hypothetical protein
MLACTLSVSPSILIRKPTDSVAPPSGCDGVIARNDRRVGTELFRGDHVAMKRQRTTGQFAQQARPPGYERGLRSALRRAIRPGVHAAPLVHPKVAGRRTDAIGRHLVRTNRLDMRRRRRRRLRARSGADQTRRGDKCGNKCRSLRTKLGQALIDANIIEACGRG